MARTPILNLDLLVERPVVRVVIVRDGVREERDCEMLTPGELSILDYHRIGKHAARVDELRLRLASGEITEAELGEFGELLSSTCRLLLRAPDEVHERLTMPQQLQVLGAFTGLQRATTARPAEAPAPAPTAEAPTPAPPAETTTPSTGASTSPA